MNGDEKSDFAIVAMKPGNAVHAADLVEPRAKAKENASQHNTHRALNRERVTQALERVRQAGHCFIVTIQGGSRMRESRTCGSVRGASSNERPYRNPEPGNSAILH